MTEPRSPLRLVTDSLANLVTGMGIPGRDKAASSTFAFCALTPLEIIKAYRGDWMARKIVDIPAEDMTREWRVWQADKDQITAIEAEEARLGLREKVRQWIVLARLTGGAGLIMDDGGSLRSPLNVRGKGGLKRILVMSRSRLRPAEINTDPASDGFDAPVLYRFSSPTIGEVDVHPSRVLPMSGAPIPITDAGLSSEDHVWGDSVLQTVLDAILHSASTNQGVAALVQEAKTDIIKVSGLMAQVATAEYRDRFMRRLELASLAKSNQNTTIIDKDTEEWDQKQVSFSNLPDVMREYQQTVCGAADIPATRFLGQSPGGLSSTGESDLRNYYDATRSKQNNRLRPAMTPLDTALIISALGATPKETLVYEWVPLWQLTAKERSENQYKDAQTAKIYLDTRIVPEAALQRAVQNKLIEEGVYPGLEQAIEDAKDGLLTPFVEPPEIDPLTGEPIDPATQGVGPDGKPLASPAPAANQNERQVTVNGAGAKGMTAKVRLPAAGKAKDAAPRSLYVSRKLLNSDDLIAWAKSQGFTVTVPADDLHVTIAYSKAEVDWMKVGTDWSGDFQTGVVTVPAGGPRLVEPLGPKGAVVLLFSFDGFTWRNQRLLDEGCSWDWDDYQPHVSITYEPGAVDLAKVTPYQGPLVFGPEIFEEVVEGWSALVKDPV